MQQISKQVQYTSTTYRNNTPVAYVTHTRSSPSKTRRRQRWWPALSRIPLSPNVSHRIYTHPAHPLSCAIVTHSCSFTCQKKPCTRRITFARSSFFPPSSITVTSISISSGNKEASCKATTTTYAPLTPTKGTDSLPPKQVRTHAFTCENQ